MPVASKLTVDYFEDQSTAEVSIVDAEMQ